MKTTLAWFLPLLGVGFLSGCGAEPGSGESVAEVQQALNICTETVPTNRYVDGFPAYAQCGAVESANVWSNNGIDTALASGGADWVQTQRGGGYQCTEWARRYMLFKWKINYQHGNAQEWCDGTLPSTLVKSTTPLHGDLIVFQGGVCGAAASTGHIAVIDTVSASAGTVTFVEQNDAGRRSAKQSCGLCFLHAVANDGSSAGAAGTGGGSAGGAASTSGGAGGMIATSGGASPGGRFGGAGAPSSGTGGGASTSSGGTPATSGGSSSGAAGAPGGSGGSGNASGGAAPALGGAFSTGGAPLTQGGTSSGGSTVLSGGGPTGASGAPIGAGAPGSSGGEMAGISGGPGAPGQDSSAIEGGCGLSGRRAPNSGGAAFATLASLALVWVRRRRR